MKIIAKKGSELEQTIEQMYKKMTVGIENGRTLVENHAGVKPANIFHLFHWGTISRLVPEFDILPDDRAKVNPHVLRKKKGCESVYVPARQYKEGKALYKEFTSLAKLHEISDEPLRAFGINTVDFERGMSYYCQPAHDTEKDLYVLVCSNSIPEAFDKKKLAKGQFDIEY